MVGFGSGVFKTGVDVLRFQIREVFEDFFSRDFRREKVEHVLHPDTHPPDTGTASALVGIEGDSLVHSHKVVHSGVLVKFSDWV